MGWNDSVDFGVLAGKVLTEIHGAEKSSDEIVFVTDTGERFRMLHYQGCCESVSVDDVEGDIKDLIGSPIVLAEESINSDPQPGQEVDEWSSFTWTFYRLATAKGFVVIRWYGESNGYYSEGVDFERA